MTHVIRILGLIVFTGFNPFLQSPAAEDAAAVTIVAGGTVLMRDVAGSYSQHPAVFAELMQAARQYRTAGDPFGVYPTDPDTVGDERLLRWSIGIRVSPREGTRLAAAPAPFRLETLPPVDAAVLETTVRRAATDGLAMLRWLPEHGYVQAGPTRMEYRAAGPTDPPLIPARIIVPVRKRASGLILPPRGGGR